MNRLRFLPATLAPNRRAATQNNSKNTLMNLSSVAKILMHSKTGQRLVFKINFFIIRPRILSSLAKLSLTHAAWMWACGAGTWAFLRPFDNLWFLKWLYSRLIEPKSFELRNFQTSGRPDWRQNFSRRVTLRSAKLIDGIILFSPSCTFLLGIIFTSAAAAAAAPSPSRPPRWRGPWPNFLCHFPPCHAASAFPAIEKHLSLGLSISGSCHMGARFSSI